MKRLLLIFFLLIHCGPVISKEYVNHGMVQATLSSGEKILGWNMLISFADGNRLYADLLSCDRHGLNVFRPEFSYRVEDADEVKACMETQMYIWGVVDGVGSYATESTARFCLVKGVNGYQYFDVVLNWLKANPAQRHQAPIISIATAMREAWPCPEE